MINKIIGRTPNPVNKILGIGRRKTVRRPMRQRRVKKTRKLRSGYDSDYWYAVGIVSVNFNVKNKNNILGFQKEISKAAEEVFGSSNIGTGDIFDAVYVRVYNESKNSLEVGIPESLIVSKFESTESGLSGKEFNIEPGQEETQSLKSFFNDVIENIRTEWGSVRLVGFLKNKRLVSSLTVYMDHEGEIIIR